MTQKVKSGLFFGLAMTFIYIVKSIIPWIRGDDFSTKEILEAIIGAVIMGLISGLIYGWLSGGNMVGKPFSKPRDFIPDKEEDVIFKTPANHYDGVNCISGIFYLTNKRIVFKSNNIGIPTSELSIKIAHVEAVKSFKMYGIINNGILIKVEDRPEEKFVVKNPNKLLELIEMAKNDLRQ